jgi:hypothetical protein
MAAPKKPAPAARVPAVPAKPAPKKPALAPARPAKPAPDPYAGMDPKTAKILRDSDQRRKTLGITPAAMKKTLGAGTVSGDPSRIQKSTTTPDPYLSPEDRQRFQNQQTIVAARKRRLGLP